MAQSLILALLFGFSLFLAPSGCPTRRHGILLCVFFFSEKTWKR